MRSAPLSHVDKFKRPLATRFGRSRSQHRTSGFPICRRSVFGIKHRHRLWPHLGGNQPCPEPDPWGYAAYHLRSNLKAMRQLSVGFAATVLLCGCQSQTGQDWLDPLVVTDYTDRVELTHAFRGAASYCAFGCEDICRMIPEPRVHSELDEQNLAKFTGLFERANASGLLLELPKRSGPIVQPMAPRSIQESQIGSVKLECIESQSRHINRIETLLNRLAPKEP